MRNTIFTVICTLLALTFTACSDDDDVVDPLLFNHWITEDEEITLSIDKEGTFEWGMKRGTEPTGYLIIQGHWFIKNNSLQLVASSPCDWCKGKRQFRYNLIVKKDGANYFVLELTEYDLWPHRNSSSTLHLIPRFCYIA
jgi:hypothetical protein